MYRPQLGYGRQFSTSLSHYGFKSMDKYLYHLKERHPNYLEQAYTCNLESASDSNTILTSHWVKQNESAFFEMVKKESDEQLPHFFSLYLKAFPNQFSSPTFQFFTSHVTDKNAINLFNNLQRLDLPLEFYCKIIKDWSLKLSSHPILILKLYTMLLQLIVQEMLYKKNDELVQKLLSWCQLQCLEIISQFNLQKDSILFYHQLQCAILCLDKQFELFYQLSKYDWKQHPQLSSIIVACFLKHEKINDAFQWYTRYLFVANTYVPCVDLLLEYCTRTQDVPVNERPFDFFFVLHLVQLYLKNSKNRIYLEQCVIWLCREYLRREDRIKPQSVFLIYDIFFVKYAIPTMSPIIYEVMIDTLQHVTYAKYYQKAFHLSFLLFQEYMFHFSQKKPSSFLIIQLMNTFIKKPIKQKQSFYNKTFYLLDVFKKNYKTTNAMPLHFYLSYFVYHQRRKNSKAIMKLLQKLKDTKLYSVEVLYELSKMANHISQKGIKRSLVVKLIRWIDTLIDYYFVTSNHSSEQVKMQHYTQVMCGEDEYGLYAKIHNAKREYKRIFVKQLSRLFVVVIRLIWADKVLRKKYLNYVTQTMIKQKCAQQWTNIDKLLSTITKKARKR